MNAALLSQRLIGHSDDIYTILETLGYENITFNSAKAQFRFSRADGTNPTSIVLDVDSLRFYCFSTNGKGNLFTLIMSRLNCTFPDSLTFVTTVLDLDQNDFSAKVHYPFGGFYRKLLPDQPEDYSVPPIPEETLQPYLGKYNQMFFRDGIDYVTQEKFQVGYDFLSNRITIPERNFDGQLCGIMGRSNDPNCPHQDRWYPIVSCPRSKTLFALQQNYQRIIETQNVVLFESEKAPMQCASFGAHISLGLCGCHVSQAQRSMIFSLRPKTIVLALDEGLEEDAIRKEAAKLVQNNLILTTRVGYVWDPDHDIIPAGSKQNPADLGRDAYVACLQTKVRWL